MTRTRKALQLAVAAGLVFGVSIGVWRIRDSQKPAVVRVAYRDFRPYVFLSPKGPDGFAAEVIGEAARRANVQLEWVRVSSGDLDEMLINGSADLFPLLTLTPERARTLHLSAPWWQNELMLISAT